jgi:hypothetical protein
VVPTPAKSPSKLDRIAVGTPFAVDTGTPAELPEQPPIEIALARRPDPRRRYQSADTSTRTWWRRDAQILTDLAGQLISDLTVAWDSRA